MAKKIRFNLYLDPDLVENLAKKGQELGVTKTGIISLAVYFGYEAIKLATNPDLQKYFEGMENEQKTDRK